MAEMVRALQISDFTECIRYSKFIWKQVDMSHTKWHAKCAAIQNACRVSTHNRKKTIGWSQKFSVPLVRNAFHTKYFCYDSLSKALNPFTMQTMLRADKHVTEGD